MDDNEEYKFDRQGRPLTSEAWSKLNRDDYRFVRRTRIGDFAWVITLWDGMDPYRLPVKGIPYLIFETTAFKPSSSKGGIILDLDRQDTKWRAQDRQERHATEEQALAYHGTLVAQLCVEAGRPVAVDIFESKGT